MTDTTPFPVVSVEHRGTFPAMEQDGVRYLVTGQGLWRETRTAWLHAALPVSDAQEGLMLPFGRTPAMATLLISAPPLRLWRQFVATARSVAPLEAAAAMLYDTSTATWRLADRTPLQATNDRVTYKEVQVGSTEVLVVDVHSHGHHEAFFSSEDDADDYGSLKVSAVIGSLAPGKDLTLALRLNIFNKKLSMSLSEDGSWNIIQ